MAAGTFTYKAFISYSHRDRAWGEWLHRQIEAYIVPHDVAGTEARDGPRPKHLRPVFRDREELSSASNLGEKVRDALDRSAYLIVVCSPEARYSRWVNEEILYFKKLGREDRILALIVDGEPHASDIGRMHVECFPDGLMFALGPDGELSKIRQEPMAADARPSGDGRAKAALKIIAGLLDVGLDVLAQRSRARAIRRAIVTGALIATAVAVSIAAGYGIWDYNRVKTAYFNGFGMRYGVPFGIGPVSESARRHRESVYAIDRQRGEIIELRLERSNHRIDNFDSFDDALEAEFRDVARVAVTAVKQHAERLDYYNSQGRRLKTYTYSWLDARHVMVMPIDASGRATTVNADDVKPISYLNDTGEHGRTQIAQFRLTLNGRGLVESRRFEDRFGNAVASPDGPVGFSYAYDTSDQLTRLTFIGNLHADDTALFGAAKPKLKSIARTIVNGQLTSITWLDDRGRPINNGHRYARLSYRLDKVGNLVDMYFYDDLLQPLLNGERPAHTHFVLDDRGFLKASFFLDRDDVPTVTTDHAAIERRLSDAQGFTTQISYFDENDLPAPSSDGYARLDYRRDDQGRIVEERYFRAGGKPYYMKASPASPGYAGLHMTYDKNGNLITQDFLDGDAHVSNGPEGFATIRWTFNAQNQITGNDFFDVSGQRVAGPGGFARLVQTWLPDGNLGSEAYFSADGRPVLHQESDCARLTYRDDHDGNRVEERCSDEQGRPKMGREGYAQHTLVKDGNGNLVETSFTDTAGNPVAPAAGFARQIVDYDASGNQVGVANFGTDGAYIAVRGVARSTAKYDGRGKLIEQSFFDIHSRPAAGAAGCASIVTNSDATANTVTIRCLNGKGEPAWADMGSYAMSSQLTRYDKDGNEIETAFYGVDGKLTALPTGTAKWELAYDALGHVTAYSIYGKDGKLLANNGIAKQIETFDKNGNLTDMYYYGADNQLVDQVTSTRCPHDHWGWDSAGHSTLHECYGVDGNLIPGVNGYARDTQVVDAHGRHISAAYFDASGKPPTASDSWYARRTWTYNPAGQEIDTRMYDASGKPTSDKDGVAEYRTTYKDGRKIRVDNFDVSGHRVNSRHGVASQLFTYDEDGNNTVTTFVALDGKHTVDEDGWAESRSRYDTQGRPLETTYWDGADQPIAKDGVARWTYTYEGTSFKWKTRTSYAVSGKVIGVETAKPR